MGTLLWPAIPQSVRYFVAALPVPSRRAVTRLQGRQGLLSPGPSKRTVRHATAKRVRSRTGWAGRPSGATWGALGLPAGPDLFLNGSSHDPSIAIDSARAIATCDCPGTGADRRGLAGWPDGGYKKAVNGLFVARACRPLTSEARPS